MAPRQTWWLLAIAGLLPLKASNEQAAVAILERHCWVCHGSAKMSGLDLRTRETTLQGGKRAPAVVPGKADESLLYKVVSGVGELKMPFGSSPLPAADVETLRRWINEGAPWNSAIGKASEPPWWAFRKPQRPPVPGDGNPIDAFVRRKLEEKGIRLAPLADKRTLIRRAYFDLTGLPPPPEEIDRFVQDSSPDAWPRLIDRLLGSPRYGERWSRYWLDVVRYADTGGFETDIYFPNAWRYRDYVVKSFNDDKPYDRFVQEQIAGDELWPDNLELEGGYGIPKQKLEHLEARIATSLYSFGPVEHEAALNGEKLRYEWLTEAVDTTGAAFLGLTLVCARCHDHKFDPLSQRDYYRMQAIFAGSEQREIPVVDMMSVFGYYTAYPRLIAADQLRAAIGRIDQRERKRVIEELKKKFSLEVAAAFEVPVTERTPRQKELAYELEVAVKDLKEKDLEQGLALEDRERRRQLVEKLGEAYLKAPSRYPTATVLAHAEMAPEVHIALRGDFRNKGEQVGPGFPAVLSDGKDIREISERPFVPQRRKALALWLTSRDHPLTARVMVNRIWQGHFGRGIVATANDFGRQGDLPTHPELLDWLANEFVAQGWSMKAMHRMMMLSHTYQMSSQFLDSNNARIDGDNRYLWRMNRRRLEAEAIHDSVLAIAGKLNLKMGGPPVVPPLSDEEMEGMWNRGQWPVTSDPEEHERRSIYFYEKRSFRYPLFEIFDMPDTSVSCPRREATTVAPQALALLNNAFMHRQAGIWAARLLQASGQDPIESAWRSALGRPPAPEEKARATKFVSEDPRAGLAQLCLLLFNMNEFLYVD